MAALRPIVHGKLCVARQVIMISYQLGLTAYDIRRFRNYLGDFCVVLPSRGFQK